MAGAAMAGFPVCCTKGKYEVTSTAQRGEGVSKYLKDIDGGLVDGAHNCAAGVHSVSHRPASQRELMRHRQYTGSSMVSLRRLGLDPSCQEGIEPNENRRAVAATPLADYYTNFGRRNGTQPKQVGAGVSLPMYEDVGISRGKGLRRGSGGWGHLMTIAAALASRPLVGSYIALQQTVMRRIK